MKKITKNRELRLFPDGRRRIRKETNLTKFYDGFKDGVHEVKLHLERKIELKDADAWLAGF